MHLAQIRKTWYNMDDPANACICCLSVCSDAALKQPGVTSKIPRSILQAFTAALNRTRTNTDTEREGKICADGYSPRCVRRFWE